jgi:hypothetical protein
MTAINLDLAKNLAKNAPWLIDEGTNLFTETLQGGVSELLGGIRDNRLTIITNQGQVFEQYQTLEINNGKIKVEKPYGWKDSTDSFYVFFRNKESKWNFFQAQDITCYPSAIKMNPPEKIFFLQRRRYRRVLAPLGTKAIFKGLDNRIDTAHVQDLSEGGMLMCVNSTKDKLPTDSIINEIFITIPPKIKKEHTNVVRRITPLINSGKIVRTFYDQEHSISYYGISFFSNSSYVKESVNRLVIYLESLLGNPYFCRSLSWPARDGFSNPIHS